MKNHANVTLVSWGLALVVFFQNPPWPLWGCGLLLGYILPLLLHFPRQSIEIGLKIFQIERF